MLVRVPLYLAILTVLFVIISLPQIIKEAKARKNSINQKIEEN
jgi:hypothetical protein